MDAYDTMNYEPPAPLMVDLVDLPIHRAVPLNAYDLMNTAEAHNKVMLETPLMDVHSHPRSYIARVPSQIVDIVSNVVVP